MMSLGKKKTNRSKSAKCFIIWLGRRSSSHMWFRKMAKAQWEACRKKSQHFWKEKLLWGGSKDCYLLLRGSQVVTTKDSTSGAVQLKRHTNCRRYNWLDSWTMRPLKCKTAWLHTISLYLPPHYHAFQKSASIFNTAILWCLASFPAATHTSWVQVEGKVVPHTPVGALTSCFWLRGGGDVLRGQDLGKAHGSSYALSQVGSRWVVGTHAVLGADSVVSLHAFHLSGEMNATATCESHVPVSWGHPTTLPTTPPHLWRRSQWVHGK